MVQFIGEDLLARDREGKLCSRIATVFPGGGTVVTLPGIHAMQRIAYVEQLDRQRVRSGLPPLTEDQQEAIWTAAVDLVIDEDGTVLIRPDPTQMDLAFEADELLQQVVSKKYIRFMYVLNPAVREAIKRRGECWRISPLPRTPEEMGKMIAGSRIGIGCGEIYYYNPASGTRLLTYQDFARLADLGEAQLRQHLQEIREYSARKNRMSNAEIAFFMADSKALSAQFGPHEFLTMGPEELAGAYSAIRQRFQALVAPEFQRDDPENPHWRGAMYAALIGQTEKSVCEETLLGLSAEFFMQVEWVPGGRIEEGELVIDPIFEEEDADTCCTLTPGICDIRARGLIFNVLRDYGDLESINIGRVAPSLSRREAYGGHRGVYLAEIRERGHDKLILRIMRMQKRGVWEQLDRGSDMLTAIRASEEYTEQILDRRLACRQLGMNLPPIVNARKLAERYAGTNQQYINATIWSTYFERDYIRGLATDKIPPGRFVDDAFALAFARVLGRAAAPNLIVGRCDPLSGEVFFDSGDELLIEDARGNPTDIMATDHTGTFMNWESKLEELALAYAEPVRRRAGFLSDPKAFGEAFLAAFTERFAQIQRDYIKRRRAFETLFKYARRDADSDLAARWEAVLDRLEAARPGALAEAVRKRMGT
jgi:hypothetical protein